MPEIPAPISDYLNKLASRERNLAFLTVGNEGDLIDWGGRLDLYGIQDLQKGEPAGSHIFYLEGLFPLTEDPTILPSNHTESGTPVDLHLFSSPEGICVLFLDVTERVNNQQSMQQRGNESSLNYQRLKKEIDRKEVLLHCIVHDLAGPLMGIKGGFELLSRENISDSGRKFLEIGMRQASRQETLIREILQAFSAEVESFQSFSVDPETAPDALLAVNLVIEALSSAYSLNQVKILLDPVIDTSKNWKVAGEKSRLERVISNLAENALRHSPANSSVTIGLFDEGDTILAAIDDQGPGIPTEIAGTLFQKFAQGKKGRGKVGLGLYFCRMTIEHWGGEIGHSPREQGGTRFWFRLPKPGRKSNYETDEKSSVS